MQMPAPTTAAAPEGRIAEILGLVRNAFIDKGFDGASMQDLARGAGMSVGNFYRYFPSKDAIVEALVRLDMEQLDQDFALIAQAPNPMQALRHALAERLDQDCCGGEGALWCEIAAAARRKPRIAEVSAQMEQAIVEKLVALFNLVTQSTDDNRTDFFRTEARMLVLLVKACAMQGRIGADPRADTELKQRVQRSIDAILDSLSKDA